MPFAVQDAQLADAVSGGDLNTELAAQRAGRRIGKFSAHAGDVIAVGGHDAAQQASLGVHGGSSTAPGGNGLNAVLLLGQPVANGVG